MTGPVTVELGWGARGLERMAHQRRAVVIVDVLSFSTAVVAGVAAGAEVFPARDGEAGARLAAEHGAVLAVARAAIDETHPFSLSPLTLARARRGQRIVLPSPNGSTLSADAGDRFSLVVAGCLRNASAAASRVAGAPSIAVVAAAERRPDGSLRAAREDLIGAGAVVAALPATVLRFPGAERAVAAFREAAADLRWAVLATESGQELVGIGWEPDVEFAAVLDADAVAPVLDGGRYRVGGGDAGG